MNQLLITWLTIKTKLSCDLHWPLSINNLNTASLSGNCNFTFCFIASFVSRFFSPKHFQPNCFVMCLLLNMFHCRPVIHTGWLHDLLSEQASQTLEKCNINIEKHKKRDETSYWVIMSLDWLPTTMDLLNMTVDFTQKCINILFQEYLFAFSPAIFICSNLFFSLFTTLPCIWIKPCEANSEIVCFTVEKWS